MFVVLLTHTTRMNFMEKQKHEEKLDKQLHEASEEQWDLLGKRDALAEQVSALEGALKYVESLRFELDRLKDEVQGSHNLHDRVAGLVEELASIQHECSKLDFSQVVGKLNSELMSVGYYAAELVKQTEENKTTLGASQNYYKRSDLAERIKKLNARLLYVADLLE